MSKRLLSVAVSTGKRNTLSYYQKMECLQWLIEHEFITRMRRRPRCEIDGSAERPFTNMALFAINTGCRVNEICNLQWDWEIDVASLKSKIFIIPGELVKNGDERAVVLNRIALSVVNSVRGKHSTHVFSFRGKPVNGMLNSARRKARIQAG